MLITGVGLPLLGVAALGISRCDGLASLSSRVGKGYGLFFTCLLYLTIGPFFAIPRCATVPFEVGVVPAMGGSGSPAALAVFSVVFFAAVLWFSLRPGKILTWVGKVLNPLFLVCLGVLLVTALANPMGSAALVVPAEGYTQAAFVSGFLEGYNTMDALAGLAFGIVVVQVIRGLGVEDPGSIAGNTVLAGCLGCGLMGVIYLAVAVAGAQTRAVYPAASNGGEVLLWMAPALFRGLRGGDPGGDRHLRLPENRGGPHHQLLRNLPGPSSPMAPPTGCGRWGSACSPAGPPTSA